MTLNPNLKDLGFYKVYNTIESFSQIEQFVSNILVLDNSGKVPVGSDEVIGTSKGFDRHSFRNTKEGSKPKKF